MAMRIVAIVLVLALGGYVMFIKYEADNPEVQQPYDQEDKFVADCEGVVPDTEPEFAVDTELIYEGEKAKLIFTISEAHGWCADHLYVRFWHVQTDENGEENQIGDPIIYMCHRYLPFGETLQEYTTLLDVEFPELDDWGTTENWRADIANHKKVLAPS